MRVRTLTTLFFAIGIFSFSAQAHAETVTMYSQLDDSGEMVSQQATFQNTWITSASLGNLVLGKDRLSITFTIKDPNASNEYHQPEGIALGTCATCQNLQKYYFTNADRILLADREFHTFTVQTGTTTIGLADGTTPIYITFFGLSQYHNSTHVKSDVAGTIPYLIIAGTPPPPAVIPEAPPGSVTVYTQSDNTGVMTNPQATFQNAHIDSVSLGNLNVGQGKLYLTFTIKDPSANNVYRQPEGVALGTCFGCRNLQTYRFTDADRTLLSDQAFHTFLVETGTTTSTYADGTRPVFISFFNLSQYQYGTKVKSNAAATIPFLSIQTAPPPDPCALPGACASNVLFLPGIEASRLYRPDYAGGTDQLWEPTSNTDVLDLFMTASGTSTRSDIYTKDVMDEAYGTFNIYKSFLADLDAWKNTDRIIADYSAVPYDWRLSLDDVLDYGRQMPDGRLYYSGDLRATSTPYVIQELRRLAAASKTGKVTIVAHSNGGLVAKALLKRLQDTHDPLLDKVDAVIMVAVPQAGTPNALGAVLHGYKLSLPLDWFSIFLSSEVAREFAHNDPMAHHLLPSASYFNGDGASVRTPVFTFKNGAATQIFTDRYGEVIDNATELHDFLLGAEGRTLPIASDLVNPTVLLPGLLSYGESVHQGFDGWIPPASTTVHEIAGWGEDTVAGITYDNDRKCIARTLWACTKYVDTLRYTPNLVVDGDGTVVAPSALAMSTSTPNVKRWWVDLKKYNEQNRIESGILGREHASILEVPQLRTFLNNLITASSTASLPTYISSTIPPFDNTVRLRFFLHSPLALSATDATGQEISASTSTIPGARYKRFGEVQYISVPASAYPTLHLAGIATGSFTLEVQEISGDIVSATTTFLGIPNATTTTAQMNFTDGTLQNASPLTVDMDADGTTDLTLAPKVGEVVVPDTTPPEIQITFATSTNALVILGTDDMGIATIISTTTYPSHKKNQKEYKGIATTTVTAKDEAGNITTLVYTEKLPSTKQRDTITLQALAYNGATTTLTNTSLSYKWRLKNNTYKLFASYIRTIATSTESHYRPKKDITVIVTKPVDLDDNDSDDDVDSRPVKQKFPGMIIPSLVTEKGKVLVTY
jgi:pimeloyl-ACP methyl ester carboxylesterase